VSAEHLDLESAPFAESRGESGGKRVTTAGQYDFGHRHGWVLGLGHEYSDLDISDPVASPQSNGHLHTLHLATQWKAALSEGELRLAAAPAVSVSSNAFKNPEVLGRDSLQLWGAALYTLRRGDIDWVLGAARDHRFGAGRVYPVAGFEWRADRFALRAVFPDIRLQWGAASGWALEADITPDGNEWLAFSRDLADANAFRSEGWQSQLGLRYRFDNGFEAALVAGWQWQQRWRYVRDDGSLAHTDGDDRAFFGVRLGWRLP
jgi:hypothetical protein